MKISNDQIRELRKSQGNNGRGIMRKILKSLGLTAAVATCELIPFGIPLYFSSVKWSLIAGAVLTGPYMEEKAKQLALKKKFGWTFGLTFGLIELLLDVGTTRRSEKTFTKKLIGRLIGVLFHISFTAIQDHYMKKGEEEKGLLIATLIHSLNNAVAVGAMLNRGDV